ncbi:hypothetical protein C2I18_17295 [Paenibacillus sp. PK3_47]|uniref:hypothetical protein n=1 Tax=Paenibacillus sp. PK3_47 TaxID=2072642 RepID=UPI00201D4A05|nr:hypothetical protein [Paenibacillus sp. PK3_47]UQZ35127.1 hypothetical protein C2I18_17295 [Paenibacillus sp. PK3_47]
MDRLTLQASLSFVLLIAAYLCLYYVIGKRTRFSRYSITVLFVASGTPLAIMLALDSQREQMDANIGLGMSFLLTWAITGLIFLLSLILGFIRLKRR